MRISKKNDTKKLTYFYDLLNLDVPRNDVLDPLSLLPSMTWNLCYQPIEASKVLVMPKVCSPISKSCGRFGQFSPHACRYKVRPSSKKWKKLTSKRWIYGFQVELQVVSKGRSDK